MSKLNKISTYIIALSLAAFLFIPSVSALEIGTKRFKMTLPKNWNGEIAADSLNLTVTTNNSDEIFFMPVLKSTPITSAQLNSIATQALAGGIELTLTSRTAKSLGGKQMELNLYKLLNPEIPEEADIRFVIYAYSQPTFQFLVLTTFDDSVSGQVLLKDLETTLATLNFSGTSGLITRKNFRNTQESFPSYDILGRNQTRLVIRAQQIHTPVYK